MAELRLCMIRVLVIVMLAWIWEAPLMGEEPAPNYLVRHWDNDSGLPASTVTALAEDREGYLWVGTPSGLARFDGDVFLNISLEGSRSLQANGVSCLDDDVDGVLWVGMSEAGLYILRNGGLVSEPIYGRKLAVNSLGSDTKGTLYAAVAPGGILRRDAGKWADFGTNGLPSSNLMQVICDGNGMTWSLCDSQPFVWRNGLWVLAAGLPEQKLKFRSIAVARKGGVWAAANLNPDNAGFRLFRFAGGRVVDVLPDCPMPRGDRSRVTCMAEDVGGTLWVGTFGGGLYFHPVGGRWKRFQDIGPLADLIINCMFADQAGSVWIGMGSGGLYQIRPSPVTVLRLPEQARYNVVQCACATHDGSVWIGTDGAGVFRYKSGVFTQFGTNDGLPDLRVGVLLEDTHGTLWAGTHQGLCSLEDGRFHRVSVSGARDHLVMSLLEDRQGQVWAGTDVGVVRVTGDAPELFDQSKGLPGGLYIALAQDKSGRIWAASQFVGLFRQVGDSFEAFGRGQWAGEKYVRSLYCDTDGSLWIGCHGKGLFQLKDGKFRSWSTADGLADDGIHGVIEDNRNFLWMASDSGIFACAKFELENYKRGITSSLACRRVSVEDGMSSKVCTGFGQPMIARTADGRFWVPNRQALAIFDPRTLHAKPHPRLPVVYEVQADDKPLVIEGNKVRVSSRINRLQFDFTAPDLVDGDRLQFYYSLENADKDWLNAGKQRVVYYQQLPPGDYRFKLKVSGPDGGWAENDQALDVELMPQWWQRATVRALALISLLGIVAGIVWTVARARARRKLRQFEIRSEVEKERRRIAQDLHDELGAGLTQLMLQADAIGNGPGLSTEARGHAERMAGQAQQLAVTTDEIVWTLNPRNDTLPNLIGYLCDYAQAFLHASTVRCRLDVVQDLPDLPVNTGARHNLLMAFKEALHNVVKHAGATEIWIHVQVKPGQLLIVVEDDGCGFDQKTLPRGGNGLANMCERLKMVCGEFKIGRGMNGIGTRVVMRLPLDGESR